MTNPAVRPPRRSGRRTALRAASGPPPSLLYVVKQVELAVRSNLDEILRPSGVTALQYTALTVLERHDGLSASELARNSFVTQQSMGDLVTTLERRDLIVRVPDPTNRRRRLISLTAGGRLLLARHRAAVQDLEERMVSDLDPTERATLRECLNRCRAALALAPSH